MKKISTATAHAIRKVESQRLTIGLDLGDRSSWYCVLDETGEVLLEQKLGTIPKTMRAVFGEMPRSRIALETGMHSPWVSRLLSELGHEVIVAHARNVRLIGESRRKDNRLDARTLARLARIDPQLLAPVKHRSAKAQADLTVIRARAGLVRADVADQHGAGTDQVLRRAAARLQLAKHETRESERAKSGTASGAGAVAGGNRIPQRADSRVQRTERAPGGGKLSASGNAEAGEGRGHADRTHLPADTGRRASFSQESRCGLLSGIATR